MTIPHCAVCPGAVGMKGCGYERHFEAEMRMSPRRSEGSAEITLDADSAKRSRQLIPSPGPAKLPSLTA